ncbi:hypothetical protein TBR22_A11780 [Luteitalea sp. TBR-22]|uniref:MBOAT family O-acyltransferase n=1 Tax=Luteitalea sp. TBR-22 TaxID=2802971 RepID=UPI001AF9D0F0|nr:MBOAT family O-acyltransferase [Luteitalea sp. TBR-22]BCS31974.1 hypothetical protein TBR22_A11780 [Luteitalea sp. TBR-22]
MIADPWFWAWLGLGVPLFWALPDRHRLSALAAMSVIYLLHLAPATVLALGAWTAVTFVVARRVHAGQLSRGWVPVLVCAILAYLAFYKYVPVIRASISHAPTVASLALPLGISYFSFKLVHYVIETSRGSMRGHGVADFVSYIFLVPIFTAGPIERFEHYLGQRESSWSAQSAAEGTMRIAQGLIKKFLVGELLLLPLLGSVRDGGDLLTLLPGLPTWKVWAFCARTFLYLYVDFSAYSDIAIGTSRLFGLRILENFNWPILATSIGDFWKRWHMTLAGWCQAYVYMPTIGLTRNPYVATYATFGAIGLWHAPSLGWILWGLYHATGLSLYGTWSRERRRRKWRGLDRPGWRWLGTPATMAFVVAGASLTALDGHGGLYARLRVLAKLLFIDLPV